MAPPPAEQPTADIRIDVEPAQPSTEDSPAIPTAPDADAAEPSPKEPFTGECRICLFGDHPENMVQPCHCIGSVKYAHLDPCLKSWVHERADLICEICRSPYNEALIPELQPVLEQALKDRARSARAHLPPLVARPITVDDDDDDEDGINWRSSQLWGKTCLALLILGFIVSLLVFLGVNAGDAVWASVMLRVIAFGLPTFIVLRVVFSCWGVSREISASDRRAAWAAGQGRV